MKRDSPAQDQVRCLIGEAGELVDNIKSLGNEGLYRLMLCPLLNSNTHVIADFTEQVMSRL